MTMTTHENAPPPADWRPPILDCDGCGHGRHLTACDTVVVTGGVALKCRCTR